MSVPVRLACLMLLVMPIHAQSSLGVIHLDYGMVPGLPAGVFQAASANNPMGYPTTYSPCGGCAWPCVTSMGDIDNDGELDILIVMEQRLVLALGFTRDPQGAPVGLYVIFAHWDPTTKVFKTPWGHDSAAIADFDGDGDNEVACLLGPGNPAQTSYRLAILEAPIPGSNPDPNFANLDAPTVLADWPINTAPHVGWTSGLLHGTNGRNMNVHAAHVSPNADPADPEPRDILISDVQNRRMAVLRYDPSTGVLQSLHDIEPVWQPFMATGAGTHTTHAYDIDGDGFDELLNNGVIDLNGGCSWDFWSIPFFISCSNQYNHADALHPIDHDGDGDLEIVAVQDCWDFLVEGNPAACTPSVISSSVIWHNTNAPAVHGQALCIGEFIAGADVFGKNTHEILVSPKGIPGTVNITAGAQWSYLYNGDSWELAFCYPSSGPVGPRDFSSRNFDWDGDRTTDEIYSRYAGTHEVWSVVPNPAWTGSTGSEPDLSGFPTPSQAAGSWPAFPYQFVLRASFSDGVWAGAGSNLTCDVHGDYREEVVVAGRNGIEIVSNLDPLTTPDAHPSPWTDLAYRRRMQSDSSRNVDYQALGALQRVEVIPAVAAIVPGSQVSYQAWAIYDNGARREVTANATFTAGSLGGFSGNVFTAAATPGLCSVQATVEGVKSDNAALVNITTDSKPVIVHAGYADSYLTGSPSDLVVEIGVADIDNDVALVQMHYQGLPLPGYLAKDDGQNGDRVAGDGIWTLTLSNLAFPPLDFAPPVFSYVEAVAYDLSINASDLWPYLTVGSGGYPAVRGFNLSPFPSENFTTGEPVKLAATGIVPGGTAAGASGSLTLFARALPGAAPDAVHVLIAGQLMPVAGMNDSGLGADQIADDGLWTGSVNHPALSDGLYAIEFIAQRLNQPGYSDAYPRLRAHQ